VSPVIQSVIAIAIEQSNFCPGFPGGGVGSTTGYAGGKTGSRAVPSKRCVSADIAPCDLDGKWSSKDASNVAFVNFKNYD